MASKFNTEHEEHDEAMHGAVSEGMQQLLNKQGKVATLNEVIFTEDARSLMADERRWVEWLKRKKLGGSPQAEGGEDGMGDIIVCDDYTVQQSESPKRTAWWMPALLGVAGLATGVGAGPTLIKWLSAAYSITQGQAGPDSEWSVRLVPEDR